MTSVIFSNEYIIFFWNRGAKFWTFFFIIILSPPPRYEPPPPPCGRTYQTLFWSYGFKTSSWYWIRIPRYLIFHLVRKMEILLEEISRENIIKWKCIALLPLHLQSQVHFIGAFMMSFSQMESRCVKDKNVISATFFSVYIYYLECGHQKMPIFQNKSFLFFFYENTKQWYFFLLTLGLKSCPLLRRKYRRRAQNA